MIPTPQLPGPRCDCCGLPIQQQAGNYCPRCGYPVDTGKEEQFLEVSIRNLQRVATYGGAQATVSNLMLRYQSRLAALRRQLYVSPTPRTANVPSPSVQQPIASAQPNNSVPPPAQIPPVITNEQATSTPQFTLQEERSQSSATPNTVVQQRVFSLSSFFADQTINIVSSLGAFLILVGSLSFVATTSDLFLSFLVLFIVHLLFAIVGLIFTRFPGFRFISRIYIIIFALLVPLVGFSGYRLVARHLIGLSAPTIVAIAATYAAIVYSLLAVNQQYKPFGYLAGVALLLADFAVAFAFHLNLWWWPILLMPLAFAALLSIGQNSTLFNGNRAVLREPTRILLYLCIGALCLDVLLSYAYMLVFEGLSQPLVELRIANAAMLFLALAWTGAYIWRTKQFAWLAVVPYQFLGLASAMAFVLDMRLVVCGLLFAAIAVFYHVITLVARNALPRLGHVHSHLDAIALVLVGSIPLLVAPLVPLQLVQTALYSSSKLQSPVNGNVFLALAALLIGSVLPLRIMLSRTGLHRIPAPAHSMWPWLLLLTGFLFTWTYSINVFILHIAPAYAFLALTLLLLIGTIVVRRYVSAAWSNPLDIVVLGEAVLALLLNLKSGIDANLALLFLFAVLSYSVVLYQRRKIFLFIPLVFLLLALPGLVERPRVALLLAVGFPILALVLAKIEQARTGYANNSITSLFSWPWPIMVGGLFYGIVVSVLESVAPVSIVQAWLGVPFPIALELAILTIVWYAVAILVRQQWLLIVGLGFAVVALLIPSNPLWVLASIAGASSLTAVCMGRIVQKQWIAPLYFIAFLAAILVGMESYTGGHAILAFVTWTLLGFALLCYVIGVVENFMPALWLASLFAIWSVLDAAVLGNLYYPPVIALVCAAIGVCIGSLTFAPTFCPLQRSKLRSFSLPLYITALASAILTGVLGMFNGINTPFPTAVPDALLLFALVAYAVLVFERQSRWLWLVAVFAFWGMVLVLRRNADVFNSYNAQVAFPTYYLTAVALVTGAIALVAGRLSRTRDVAPSLRLGVFAWSWPWYCTALFAVVLTVIWNTVMEGMQASGVTVYGSLFAFILLTFVVMFVEDRRELFVLPILLILWAIVETHWELWQQLGVLGLLFFLVFAMPYVWQFFPTGSQSLPQRIGYILLGFIGQVGILLQIFAQGGLSPNEGILAHIGIGVLLLLAVQLFVYGWAQQEKQYWTFYVAGLLVTFAIPWQLATVGLTRIEWLTLGPATYLVVVAPFLSRNEHIPYHARLGQLCSIVGASLLLLPTLWSSFSELNIQPTLILTGEALALLLLGVALRTRFFVLSGAALVIVSAMHALFLPSLGLPPSLALTIMGATLLALATALSLARHRLQSVWTRLD